MTVVLLHNPCLPQTRLFLWCWFCMYCCLAHCPQSCRKSLQRVLRKRNYIFGYHPHGATQLPSILSSAWGSCEQRQKAEGAMPGSTPKLSGLSTSPSREPRIRGDQHGGVVQLRHGGLSTKIPKNITRCRKPCSNPYRTPSPEFFRSPKPSAPRGHGLLRALPGDRPPTPHARLELQEKRSRSAGCLGPRVWSKSVGVWGLL